ncbi:DNA repair protein RecO [Allofrancisella guangzhouensis]|uniref:DNA repair protein RecO n=1 Tax=Allofrancisella guangzhouensis TaxID=594679 RepID=A0A0A8E4U3_9GAMM|nr:DNA repair protein RecO [Allofrancisella guangzhouensis]AJC48984.1 DNA recombination protein RecO [Allofrancisella guangzhouensis]MBK2027889.1 DNA repair protein RecO [Allofrancisella guangzhouensis]MBK2044142.1 DNA repair protein RecO [Allofrancisella guangzhouensis]MBK2045122.1 DNA repair protein RecO [Allofrancisella guangzhouensis]
MKDKLYDFYILHQRKYKENSLLVSIFTSEFGKLSGIIRTNKKQQNLYQPLTKLQGQIRFSKRDTGLNKIYNIEFVDSFYKKSYINLLALQYINELIFLLLSYSHEDDTLFKKYDFMVSNMNDDNYKYLLRFFELELLESLGQGVYVEQDLDGYNIEPAKDYDVLFTGFRESMIAVTNSVKGLNLMKIREPLYKWSEQDLKTISRITRLKLDGILAGKQLKSRKLLLDYLNLKR